MASAFIPAGVLPSRRMSPPYSCRRRRLIVAQVGGKQNGKAWNNSSEYNTMGKGVSQKGIQRIEFVIRQDGTVEETVTGVKGAHCESLTEKIEEALGRVVHTSKTEEYFEEAVEVVEEKNVVQDGVAWEGNTDLPTW